MASGEHEELHSLVEIARPTSQQVNDDLLSQTNTLGQRFKTATPDIRCSGGRGSHRLHHQGS